MAEEPEVAAGEHSAMLADRTPAIRLVEDIGAAAVMQRECLNGRGPERPAPS